MFRFDQDKSSEEIERDSRFLKKATSIVSLQEEDDI
jgi:hypothetical protein